MSKLSNGLTTFIKIIFAVVIGYLYLLSIYSTSYVSASYNEYQEYTYYVKDRPWIHVLILIAVVALFGVGKWIQTTRAGEYLRGKSKVFRYVFPLLVFAVLAFWIWATDVRLAGDQYETFFSAESLLLGDYSQMAEGGYIYIYPNQVGLMLLESTLVLIFGARADTALLVLNILSLMLTFLLLAKIVRLVFGQQEKSIAYITYFATATWLPLLFYVCFSYGNLIGLMLSTAGLWFTLLFLQQHNWKCIIAGAICVAAAILVKNNYLIILLAMVVLLLLDAIRTRGWKALVGIVLCAAAHLLSSAAVNACVERMTGMDVNEGIPKQAWIAMGLQENDDRASGWYNGYNILTYTGNGFDADKTKEACVESIKSDLGYMADHPGYALRFFGEKIASQWNNPTFQCFWLYKFKTTTKPGQEWLLNLLNDNRGLVAWLNIIQSLILGGTFLYLLCNWKRIGLQQLLLPVAFLGGFFFHLIWEAKAQYTFTYFVLLIPYAVMGLTSMAQKIAAVRSGSCAKQDRNNLVIVVAVVAAVILAGAIPTKLAQNTWQLEENDQLLQEWQWE
ncbi:MAG: glycosyltransferase family 39 protein [Agathobacter sp.]|nr:glycosyltransferase family 39 protein [Agathobacter sp.]